jgi:predicted murein hydrolase (TIGR00659 family)
MQLANVIEHPIFGVALTVMAYAASRQVSQRWPKVHPLFLTSVIIMLFLGITGIPNSSYQIGGELITFMLGPSTVALGVPLYKHYRRIRRSLLALMSGITVGALSGMVSAALLVWLFGGTHQVILSVISKSVTTPISIEITTQLGGYPELAASITVLTGLLGSMIGSEFLRLCGIRSDLSLGAAVGNAAHGIGTARVLAENELAGGVSSFSMAVAGIVVSLLCIPLYAWLAT